jgi:Rieske 2Fe-2S family protein
MSADRAVADELEGRARAEMTSSDAATVAAGPLARTLPGAAYTSPAVQRWEVETLFAAEWVCVGRSVDLREAGAQRAVRAGSEGVLLVRDDTGALRCFYNVCRHRGHELLDCGESSRHRYIRCPYHAWAYRLDGSLRATPNFDDLPDDDPSRTGLVPIRVTEWRGWAFVNLSGDAPELMTFVDDLDDWVGSYSPETLVQVARHEYEVRANWKVITENYHECLHCPSIHPELVKLSASDSGTTCAPRGRWVGGTMDLREGVETMSVSGRGGQALPGVGGGRLREVVYVSLFPNLLISMHPDYVMTHRLEPLAADRTLVECEWMSLPANRDSGALEAAVTFWDITNHQDWTACESVQRGAASAAYRPGPLGYQESSVAQFVETVREQYRLHAFDPAAVSSAG